MLNTNKTGPLYSLIPVFVDVETFMDNKNITLKKLTLGKYLEASQYLSLAIAVGDEEVRVYKADDNGELPEGINEELQKLTSSENHIFVAHNAAFDARVLIAYSGCKYPVNVWCTFEGALGAWPELPGGYSLKKLGNSLNMPQSLRKLEIDLTDCTEDELIKYNKVDVEAMRWLYYKERERLPEQEQWVAIRTHRQRQFSFKVVAEKLDALIGSFESHANEAADKAKELLNEQEMADVFNTEDGPIFSIRSARLLKVLNNKFGLQTNTTSLKKIPPVALAMNSGASALLKQTSTANKAIWHKRNAKRFKGIEHIGVELGYMRAHTGRFSSPAVGGSKGLNLHNMPKHDKKVAKPVKKAAKKKKSEE